MKNRINPIEKAGEIIMIMVVLTIVSIRDLIWGKAWAI